MKKRVLLLSFLAISASYTLVSCSNDDDFGPKWCMNTQEVSSGFALLIALFLAGIILCPAFLLGMYLGAKVWNVKILKYSLGVTTAMVKKKKKLLLNFS